MPRYQQLDAFMAEVRRANPVCAELQATANAFEGRKRDLHITPEHMGGCSAIYRNFAANHDHVVVMGFDAPLTSMTHVVTSRALLAMQGQIFPFDNRGEYGVLNGL